MEIATMLFVFRYRSWGDYSYIVMATSLDEAIDSILSHQEKTGEGSWTREELAVPGGHFEHEILSFGEVATFAN